MILAVLHKLTHYKQVINIAGGSSSQNIFINAYIIFMIVITMTSNWFAKWGCRRRQLWTEGGADE